MPLSDRPKMLALALVFIAAAIVIVEEPWAAKSSVPPPPAGLPPSEEQYPAAADFGGATGWVGSAPVDLVALRGKVVLVDFWTYSCINCIHTLPYVEGWYERYKDDGFVVVGIHTPEFRFEHDAANIADARERYHLTYPVAQDNDYAIWNAYHNRFWPAKYLVDPYGRIRDFHAGEGGYAAFEAHIRDLLTEAGHAPTDAPMGESAGGMRHNDRTPELYAAAAQGIERVAIGNPEGYHPGRTITYARPSDIAADRIYLVGTWQNNDQDVVAAGADTLVLVRFKAGAGNFVAGGGEGTCATILLDGAPIPRSLAAHDVVFPANASACIPLDGPRSYDFFAGPYGEHVVELQVPQGFALFTFDFSDEAAPGGTA